MTSEEWDASDEWMAMLSALSGGVDRRRLRLWSVAFCRFILTRHADDPITTGGYEAVFTQLAESVERQLLAAERYSDGQIDRPALQKARSPSGGPWNVFNVPTWMTRMNVTDVQQPFRDFSDEFGVPTSCEAANLLRDIFGNPYRRAVLAPVWRSESAVSLARTAYNTRNFTLLPILADALEEAGCDHPDVLTHCRDPKQVHVRGCWVVDGVLGKV